MSLLIKIEGTVREKQIKVWQGERKPSAKVTFEGGFVKVKLPPERYEEFPAEGSPVVLVMTGDVIAGEFGVRIEQLKYVKHEGAAPGLPGSARRAA